MQIYFAGFSSFTPTLEILKQKHEPLPYLESFFYLKEKTFERITSFGGDFFLDSGAFSAWSKKKSIDLDKYIAFIKSHQEKITLYATLDDISDPKITQRNTEYMQSFGLSPIPVFHYNEPWEVLEDLIKCAPYIALGGMVPISTKDLIPWLDSAFSRICNADGTPKVKVHGFGLTTVVLMERYPWESVDSTSPIMAAAMGRILLPEGGDISLSQQTGILTEIEKQYILSRGYDVKELIGHYRPRQVFNVESFLMLQEKLEKNPVRFVQKQTSLL